MDLSSPKISLHLHGYTTPKLNIEQNVFGGQTPTPTKLIENCEKFGIFDDLNKNPFEEVFRQAVEYSHSDPIRKGDEDSLHTPQVLGLQSNSQEVVKNTTSKRIKETKKKNIKPRQILPNNIKPLIVSNGILISQPQVISITTFPQNSSLSNNSATISSSQEQPKQILKEFIASKGTSSDHKERKRAASSRYRQKSKLEFIELKRKFKSLLHENLMLKNRISELEDILSSQNSSTANSNQNQSVINIEPSTVKFQINIPKILIRQISKK